MQPTELITAK